MRKFRDLKSFQLMLILDIFFLSSCFLLSIVLYQNKISFFNIQHSKYFTFLILHFFVTLSFWIFLGVNKHIIKYYKVSDYLRLILAIIGIHTLSYFLHFLNPFSEENTVKIYLVSAIISCVFLIVSRLLISFVYEKFLFLQKKDSSKKILIYGAGNNGFLIKNWIEQTVSKKYLVTGYIDDDVTKIGRYLNGVRIYSQDEAINTFIKTGTVVDLIFSIENISPKAKSLFIGKLLPYDVKIKIIKDFNNWYDSPFNIQKLSNINIIDLLGRDHISINNSKIKEKLINKTVLITGAAGSIGCELVKKIAFFNNTKIICVDFNETGLYNLEQDLKSNQNLRNIFFELCDIRNSTNLLYVFKKYNPNYIFHAAAYKHVPMMEEFPWNAIQTNVFGTWNLINLAIQYNISDFVLISTDKAVNPTSIMGITKRLSEIITKSIQTKSANTNFVITRFGNVLGSNGSVLPLFSKQIENGGPITITHEQMERYFMTIPEACSLVLEAFAMGNNGEVFVFDMGKPLKIKDLAIKLIQIAGLEPHVDIKIQYVGIRKGEKLSEEIFHNEVDLKETYNKKIFISTEPEYDETLAEYIINELKRLNDYNIYTYKSALFNLLNEVDSKIQNTVLI